MVKKLAEKALNLIASMATNVSAGAYFAGHPLAGSLVLGVAAAAIAGEGIIQTGGDGKALEHLQKHLEELVRSHRSLAAALRALAAEQDMDEVVSRKRLAALIRLSRNQSTALSQLADQNRHVAISVSIWLEAFSAAHSKSLEEVEGIVETTASALGIRLDRIESKIAQEAARSQAIDERTHDKLEQLKSMIAGLSVGFGPLCGTHTPHEIPAPPPDFTGRCMELQDLHTVYRTGVRRFGIHGPGGAGKSCLASRFAADLLAEFPDGQIQLDMGGSGDQPLTPEAAMLGVIRSLAPGQREFDQERLAAFYRSVLFGKRLIFLLDDARSAGQIERILPPNSCLLIVTARQQFTTPGLHQVDLNRMIPDDAEAFLSTVCPRIGSAAGDLSKLCAHLPLALRLAATALAERADIAVEDYVQRLRSAADPIRILDRDRPDSGVGAAISASCELLPNGLSTKWPLLGAFNGQFTPGSAAAAWGIPDMVTVQDHLSDLIRHSFLQRIPDTPLYRLHDLLRAFAVAHVSSEQKREVSQRLREYTRVIIDQAQQLFLTGDHQVATAALMMEWQVISANMYDIATEMASSELAAQEFFARAYAITFVLWNSAPLGILRQITFSMVQAARKTAIPTNEITALNRLGEAYERLHQFDEARSCFENALQILDAHPDPGVRSQTLISLGTIALSQGRLAEALVYVRDAWRLTKGKVTPSQRAAVAGTLGHVFARYGKHRRAIVLFNEQRRSACEARDKRQEAMAIGNLSSAYAETGQFGAAREMAEQRLSIAKAMCDLRGEIAANRNLWTIYGALGESRLSMEALQRSVQLSRMSGDPDAEKWSGLLTHLEAAGVPTG